MNRLCLQVGNVVIAGLTLCLGPGKAFGDDAADTKAELQELKRQNELLQQQLRQQQEQIEKLTQKMADFEKAAPKADETVQPNRESESAEANRSKFLPFNKVILSGEAAAGFFNSGPGGQYPNHSFRIDEAKLFLDAQLWEDIYFYTELNLTTRETGDENLHLGEIYFDFENVSQNWGWDKALSVRAGRMYIPFGEEYQSRYAVDDPLITHSLSDLWGVDEGVEIYGSAKEFHYALAVQNGGDQLLSDGNSDKSVAGRVGYDPVNWAHLSVSAMRTGDLDPQNDRLSALWFGNGFFRSTGSSKTTAFHANLLDGDARIRLPRGHLAAWGGYAEYGDNDPTRGNGRHIYYYAAEAQHDLFSNLYAAARFSQILSANGYPIVGNGDFGDYFFGAATKDLWRMSFGLGYRITSKVAVKFEYALENGETVTGEKRDHEDFWGFQVVGRF